MLPLLALVKRGEWSCLLSQNTYKESQEPNSEDYVYSFETLNKESSAFNVYANVFSFPKLEVKHVVSNSVGSTELFLKMVTENNIPHFPGCTLWCLSTSGIQCEPDTKNTVSQISEDFIAEPS